MQLAALDQVLEPARRPDDEARIAGEAAQLVTHVRAADAERRVESRTDGEFPQFVLDLERQFARRHDDQGLLGLVLEGLVDERKKERGCLAGTGIGDADHVASVQDMRNRSVLDRGRVHIAARSDDRLQLAVHLEISETMCRIIRFCLGCLDRLLHELREVDLACGAFGSSRGRLGKAPAAAPLGLRGFSASRISTEHFCKCYRIKSYLSFGLENRTQSKEKESHKQDSRVRTQLKQENDGLSSQAV